MANERARAGSRDVVRLAQKMRQPRYRESYVGSHVRQFLARQMRSMRNGTSQEEFGVIVGKPQNVVSRFEDPYYGKWTLTSLLEIASKLDRAVIVRFVDYPTFLKFTQDQSEEAAAPEKYKQEKLEWAASLIAMTESENENALKAFKEAAELKQEKGRNPRPNS